MEERAQERSARAVNRRSFLKSAAAVTGAAGVLSVSGSALAKSPIQEYVRGDLVNLTIKHLDDYPFDLSAMRRVDETQTVFAFPQALGQYLMEAKVDMGAVAMQKTSQKVPGFTQVDYALQDCSWSGDQGMFYSWEGMGVANKGYLPTLGPWKGTPEENNLIVKKAARLYGAADVGVCKTNELWFYSKDRSGVPITFTDTVDKPTVTPEAKLIPKSMQTMIVCLIAVDLQQLQFCPSPLGEAAIGLGYSRMAELAGTLAEFIRQLGYNAIPMGNDTCLSTPAAIDAGLGEFGRVGFMVSPVLGTSLRICKVLTDMPVAPDKRIKFGVEAFCKTCKKCAIECPSGSISMDDEPNGEATCPGNMNVGVKRWLADGWKCFKFWNENGTDCGVCMRTCPYSKPQTWLHDVVKGVSATTPMFNRLFISLDKALGYGTPYNPTDAELWWKSEEWWKKG